jgi:hypothetical protein
LANLVKTLEKTKNLARKGQDQKAWKKPARILLAKYSRFPEISNGINGLGAPK